MQKRRGKTKKRTSCPAKKQLSAVTIQNLRALAEQIGNIIPATSFRKGAFCFQNLAKKLGHQKDWPTHGAKKELIFGFLKALYRNHPKTFYKVFRENIAQGIERRLRIRTPAPKARRAKPSSMLSAMLVLGSGSGSAVVNCGASYGSWRGEANIDAENRLHLRHKMGSKIAKQCLRFLLRLGGSWNVRASGGFDMTVTMPKINCAVGLACHGVGGLILADSFQKAIANNIHNIYGNFADNTCKGNGGGGILTAHRVSSITVLGKLHTQPRCSGKWGGIVSFRSRNLLPCYWHH